eukprot:CAMPEP_0204913026 /NCGR_PEP_ID=MMETSP1397-20131031/11071_1 /ASSEMBLY_ACC=CAM_ASM_000891 /TAXON_ID=49980 /ORGANISM="Climacostomum Climacostomum virens, Strain Stock W-24" /LENGTH=65 /DNA_ID=CAMNT_0052084203 /DNA_START=1 /DNA_END=195 /DNA_ORIENTATION=+
MKKYNANFLAIHSKVKSDVPLNYEEQMLYDEIIYFVKKKDLFEWAIEVNKTLTAQRQAQNTTIFS